MTKISANSLIVSLTFSVLLSCGVLFAPAGTFSLDQSAQISAEPKAKKKKRKKKKRKGKEYNRRRRQAQALIKEGHPTVELSVRTTPRIGARVYHGKELIGRAPFSIKWPKDTGSLDLVVKASGYIPVNTRLYTYRDDKVTVKMFKENEAHKLFGYRKKIEPPKEGE